jgi:hypothetical protein
LKIHGSRKIRTTPDSHPFFSIPQDQEILGFMRKVCQWRRKPTRDAAVDKLDFYRIISSMCQLRTAGSAGRKQGRPGDLPSRGDEKALAFLFSISYFNMEEK